MTGSGRAAGQRVVFRMAALLAPALVVCQFGLIAALITEPRIVPGPLLFIADRALSPWFTQDWRLFAPAPDVHDYQVYARGAYHDDGHPGQLARTPWISLMDPLVAAVQTNRLDPAVVRLEIVHKSALFSMRAAGPLAMTPLGRDAIAERWSSVERQPPSVVVLVRMASVTLAEQFPGRQFETVQLLVTARPVVSLGGASLEDSELAYGIESMPFQDVQR